MKATLPSATGENLFRAALRSYEEIQNVRLLVRGAGLALDSADEVTDQFAVQEILQAAMRKCDEIVSALNAANAADADAVILQERERQHRGGGAR